MMPATSEDAVVVRIGKWRVDPALDEISSEGCTVRLEPLAMRLLLCLARHAGRPVEQRQLLDEVWPGVMVAQGSVYQAIAQLRRTLGDDTEHPTYIDTVPRKGYRLIAPVSPWIRDGTEPASSAGHVALEPPEHPILPATDQAAATPIQKPTSPRGPVLLGSVVSVVAVIAALTWFERTTHAPAALTTTVMPPERSIAVLPFVDLSEKHDQEYFADGMAEEVLDLLANIPGVKVIGRTSSFQFKGKNEDLRVVGGTLGVRYVVEGSVRKSGDRVRVTAQLIDTEHGSHVWSDTYEEPVDDALRIQDKIAANLVRGLQVAVGADYQQARPSFRTAEEYDLYLRGRHAIDRWDKGGLESAAAYFQQVLDLNPNSAPAAAWLATAQEDQAVLGYVDVRDGMEHARSSAQRALKLDPNSREAYAALAFINLSYDWDWAAAERNGKEAVRLAPRDPMVVLTLGNVYAALGRWDESTRVLETALNLDPLLAVGHAALGNVRLATGRLHEAEAEARKVLQISPRLGEGQYVLGTVLLVQGKFDAALAAMQQEPSDGSRYVGLAMVYYAMGRSKESDAALERAAREHGQDDASEIADGYAYRGQRDQAFNWFERAYRQKDTGLWEIKSDPFFKALEDDPRYKAFLGKMNLPE
jgi:TolB-like protein/DNA-binding winged helix-turn-helix (wHTH) protein/Tfp pilus assembly protein PilF